LLLTFLLMTAQEAYMAGLFWEAVKNRRLWMRSHNLDFHND